MLCYCCTDILLFFYSHHTHKAPAWWRTSDRVSNLTNTLKKEKKVIILKIVLLVFSKIVSSFFSKLQLKNQTQHEGRQALKAVTQAWNRERERERLGIEENEFLYSHCNLNKIELPFDYYYWESFNSLEFHSIHLIVSILNGHAQLGVRTTPDLHREASERASDRV